MNNKLKELLEEAGFKIFGDKIVAADNSSSGLATVCAPKLVELAIKKFVDTLQVDGSDFYYNYPNDYGCITIKIFTDEGDPRNKYGGEEVFAQYVDGYRGTGRFRLNDNFSKFLLNQMLQDLTQE